MSASTSSIATFCKELREAREYKNITLAEVAAMTRVTSEYLAALETGEWNLIPPAFLRGYLRLYARAVGMNCEKVLRTFDNLNRPEQPIRGAVLDSSAPLLRQPEHRGITRAKIRTSWFASFSQNKKAAYPVSFAAVVLLIAAVIALRNLPRSEVARVTWVESLAEYRGNTHGPRTTLSGEWEESLPAHIALPTRGVCEFRSASPGLLTYSVDKTGERSMRFRSYDTLLFAYYNSIELSFYPPNGVDILINGKFVYEQNNVTSSDTARLLFTLQDTVVAQNGDPSVQLQ